MLSTQARLFPEAGPAVAEELGHTSRGCPASTCKKREEKPERSLPKNGVLNELLPRAINYGRGWPPARLGTRSRCSQLHLSGYNPVGLDSHVWEEWAL